MVVAAILFVILTILWAYFLWSRRKYYAFALKMPGPMGLPFIGIAHKIYKLSDVLYELPKIASQYQTKTFYTWIFHFPTLYTIDPEIAEIILNSPDCINRSRIYDAAAVIFGDGIFTRKSPSWNKYRKLLSTCVKSKTLLSYFPKFNALSHEFSEELNKYVDCGEVNIRKLLNDATMKLSLDTMLGMDLQQQSSTAISTYMERLLAVATDSLLKPWVANFTIFSRTSRYSNFMEALNFVRNFISEKIRLHEQQGVNACRNEPCSTEDLEMTKHIFVEQAIQFYQKNVFTFNDTVVETIYMMFSTYETLATTLFSTLMCLAMHPEYQEKAFEEIIAIFPQKDFEVKYEVLESLVYLEMCINETLRVAPTIPHFARECTNDVPISKDLVLPKGTQIIIDVFSMHRNENIWGLNAKTFNPDNFLPTNVDSLHKYSFMPFAKGPRNCLGYRYAGMFMKVLLVHILRKYRFSTKFRFEDVRFHQNVSLQLEQVPLLEIYRR